MDLQERLALDLARQRLGKVKARARPWRSIFALFFALVVAVVSVEARHAANDLAAGRSGGLLAALDHTGNLALSYGAAVAFLLFAGIATIGLGNKARQVLQPSVGSSHAAVVRFAVLVIAGLVSIVITMQLCAIPITQLVVGGALTGVLVGIAAQQSLANVFAGMVLLVARPFRVGDHVGIRSGSLGGLLEGTVSEVSVTYVRLETSNGPVYVPNSQVLAAAVGPAGAVPSPVNAPPPGPGVAPAGPGSAPPAQGTPPPGPGPSPAEAAVVAGALADEGALAGQPDQAGHQDQPGQQIRGDQPTQSGQQAQPDQQAQSGQQAQDARQTPTPAPPGGTPG